VYGKLFGNKNYLYVCGMRTLLDIYKKVRSLHGQKERAMCLPVMERGGSVDYLNKQIKNHLQSLFLHPDNDVSCESLVSRCEWKKVDDVELCASCGRGRLCGS